MHRIHNALHLRVFLNRIATVATVLAFCGPGRAVGQMSGSLASPTYTYGPASVQAYIYWTNSANGSGGQKSTALA